MEVPKEPPEILDAQENLACLVLGVSLVVLEMLVLKAKLAHLVPQEKMDDLVLLVHKVPVVSRV